MMTAGGRIEDKCQRFQDEIAMVAAECQDESPTEWDVDEERVWKHRLKHIEDVMSKQTYECVQRQKVSQRVVSYRWVDTVRSEKGTRCGMGIEQMRFCRVICWNKFTLNLQQKHRSPQMLWRFHKGFPGLKEGSVVAWRVRIDGILGSLPLNFTRSRVG